MAKTATHLYRSLMGDRAKQFKIKTARGTDKAANIYPGDGVLYPQFEEEEFFSNAVGDWVTRAPDLSVVAGKTEPEVLADGGTSLHDVSGFFPVKEFWIPEGTEYTDEIHIRKDRSPKWNKKRTVEGTHYQLEPRVRMTKAAFEGALDNMARAAVVRQIDLAKGKATA